MYLDMCRSLPGRQADADALLAGTDMPSVAAKRRGRAEALLAAGGEVIGADR